MKLRSIIEDSLQLKTGLDKFVFGILVVIGIVGFAVGSLLIGGVLGFIVAPGGLNHTPAWWVFAVVFVIILVPGLVAWVLALFKRIRHR